MEFDGNFEIEDATVEEVWLALSDPVLIKQCLDGCQYMLAVDGEEVDFDAVRERVPEEDPSTLPEADAETIAERAFDEGGVYATEIGTSVGSVNPTFETVVRITDREFPAMTATAEGAASNSSVELTSWMELTESDDGGVLVEWGAETEVFGRVAQLGGRVINPVANRIVNRFFSNVESRLVDVGEDEAGVGERIRNLL